MKRTHVVLGIAVLALGFSQSARAFAQRNHATAAIQTATRPAILFRRSDQLAVSDK